MNDPTTRLLARVPISVRWRDLDAYNHVNNSTFLTYLEEARLVWLAGIDGEWLYHVIAFIFLLAVSSCSVRRFLPEGEKLYSDASVVMVWINPSSGKPVPLPEGVRAACA